jgi:hypothetical protein
VGFFFFQLFHQVKQYPPVQPQLLHLFFQFLHPLLPVADVVHDTTTFLKDNHF